jgi:hypothetical protein
VGHDTDAEAYFTEIEALFAFRRGTPFVLSGKDWALMKSWHEAGIPLAIVLEAIDTAFDARERSGRRSPISSLSYCRHAVVDLWEERRQQLVGGKESVPELDPAGHVRQLAETLQGIAETTSGDMAVALTEAARALAALAEKGRSAPAIEERLIEIENRMIEALLDAFPDARRREMLSSIDAELARYDIPAEEVRTKTREANLRRLVRRELRIPRLSLFG